MKCILAHTFQSVPPSDWDYSTNSITAPLEKSSSSREIVRTSLSRTRSKLGISMCETETLIRKPRDKGGRPQHVLQNKSLGVRGKWTS
jgi:hypothetical protein